MPAVFTTDFSFPASSRALPAHSPYAGAVVLWVDFCPENSQYKKATS